MQWPMEERPAEVDRLLADRGLLDDVVLSVASDVGPDGRFGRQWLVVTPGRTLVVALRDGRAAMLRDLPTRELRDVRVDVEVGGAVLQARRRGLTLPLVHFSNSRSNAFARAAKGIERLAADGRLGEPPPDDEEEHFCPTCGRRLPHHYFKVCPVCLKRRKVLARLLGLLRSHWRRVVVLFVLMGLTVTFELVPPRLWRSLIDDILPAKGRTGPAPAGGVALPLVGEVPRGEALLILVLLYLASMALATMLRALHVRFSGWLGNRVTFELRSMVYQALQRLSLSFYDRRQVGHVMASVTHDTAHLRQLLVDEGPWFVVFLLQGVAIAIYALVLNWRLALWMWVPVPAIVVMTRWVWPWLRRILRRLWERRARLSGHLNDSLSGIRVVRAFGQERREVQRFEDYNREFFQADVRMVYAFATLMPAMHFLIAVGGPVIWYIGGRHVIAGLYGMTTGKLMQFVFYVAMFYRSVQMITRMVRWVSTSLTATERVFEIIDTEPEIQDAPDAVPMPRMKGHVRFEHVTFGYSKLKPVLHDIDIEVKPGEMIGLVGHSGAGKSTIINLLARFYDVDEGRITIDGVDIRKIPKDDLHRQMGVVLQETFLFNGTVAENIAYAKPDATRREIMKAAKAANAHDFIVNLPDGYDFQVGERGQRLSVGERQRIAIARAILGDPRILILDEATASVDTETEQQIQEALTRLTTGRTTFAIAHRLSTLRNADRLYVLDHGRLAEVGTHEELLAKRGSYYRLVKMQREISRMKAVGG